LGTNNKLIGSYRLRETRIPKYWSEFPVRQTSGPAALPGGAVVVVDSLVVLLSAVGWRDKAGVDQWFSCRNRWWFRPARRWSKRKNMCMHWKQQRQLAVYVAVPRGPH